MLKRIARNTFGTIVLMPLIITFHVLRLTRGRDYAVRSCGHRATAMAKAALRSWVPDIKEPSEFDVFRAGLKGNFRFWQLLFDISVIRDDKDAISLKLTNCPFCEPLRKLGCPELARHVCQGDWEVARQNADKWVFSREHQIGTGDTFCDHTYSRKA